LKEFFGHCSYHNARKNSLLFSILEMLLTGSDCFDVISDSFDSFFRDLHAFRPWPPPEIRQVEQKYYGKFESFGKEFRRIEVERVSTPSQVFWLNHLSTS